MTTRKFGRTALIAVLALSIIMSITGGTIAWFTDEVTSANNVITAGNLDVDVYFGDATAQNSIQDKTELFDSVKLWEPGAVAWENLTVVNKGNLALKYEMSMNATNENTLNGNGLSTALQVGIVEDGVAAGATREAVLGAVKEWVDFADFKVTGDIKANEAADVYGVVVYWAPKANDNDWNVNNGKEVSDYATTSKNYLHIDLGVKLVATQLTAEEDAFDDQYDAGAYLSTVGTAAELMSALSNGGNIKLSTDIELSETPIITKDTVVDLNGKTLSQNGERAYALNVSGDADLTVKNGKLVAVSTNGQEAGTGTSTGSSSSIYFASTGNLKVENVEIEGSKRGGHRAIEVFGGKAEINNVKIDAEYGSGVNVSGKNTTAELTDCDITVTGMYSAPYNSVCFSVMNGGNLTIKNGNYKLINNNTYNTGDTHGGWVGIVMSSGGTITTLGGTYTNVPAEGFMPQYERAILEAENNAPAVATLNLFGGTFIPQYDKVHHGYGDQYYPVVNGKLTNNGDRTWTASYEGSLVSSAEDLTNALTAGKDIMLTDDIDYENGIVIPEGISFDGNGNTITYTGTDYDYQLVKLNTGADLKNVNLKNYRVRTEETTNGMVTLQNVTISMDNDLTGLDISRGTGTAKLTNVECKGITDATHLDPSTTVQVDYTPYGDVLLGTKWGLEATDCEFGSLHGWNTTNGSNVSLTNTTYTVFRMHYWNNRKLYINGVETAWSESGAIPVAHDVGGCWSVQPAFK